MTKKRTPRTKPPKTSPPRQQARKRGSEPVSTVARLLGSALEALDAADDPQRAFSLLRQAWEETRWPRLARLVEAIGRCHQAEAAGALPAAFAGTKKRVPQADWLGAEKRLGPLQRGALLATLTSGTIKEVGERIERIESWEPDPRVSAALIEIVARVPWVSSGSRTTWTKVYRALRALPDPRLLEVAKSFDSSALPTGWQGARDFFDGKLAALAAEVQRRTPLTPEQFSEAEEALIGRLEQRLGGPAESTGAEAEKDAADGLLQQVLAHLDDDQRRAVLADLLQQRGDIRGELIGLQLIEREGKLSKDQRARKKEIIKQSTDHLMGPLAPLVLKRGLTFDRGFVYSCVLKDKLDARDVEAAIGHPFLGFVREIEGPLSFVLQPALRNLRLIALPAKEDLSLLRAARELPIDSLACYVASIEDAELVGGLENIARVETFYAICPSLSFALALLRTPLARRRLRHLCIDSRPMWASHSISVEEFPRLFDAAMDTSLEKLSLRWDHYYTGSFIGRPHWGRGIMARRVDGKWQAEGGW